MADGRFLIYGAYGYTGRLVAEEAVRRGLAPVLAGRDGERVRRLGEELHLETRSFPLDDTTRVARELGGVRVVLSCAGPFTRTAPTLVGGCLTAGVHYLDVTGELEVFEKIHGLHEEARRAGVVLMPGVGFDIVPSDCLAAHLASRLPTADRLTLALSGLGTRPSHGTLATVVEGLGSGGAARVDGHLVQEPIASSTRIVDFGRGPRRAVSVPWPDVFTAYLTTGIPNIRVLMAAPPLVHGALVAAAAMGPLLESRLVRATLRRLVNRLPEGPGAEERAGGVTVLWGEAAEEGSGRRVAARQRGPDGYTTTVLTALAAVDRLLTGDVPAGFHTPGRCLGADFVLGLEGFSREDLTEARS